MLKLGLIFLANEDKEVESPNILKNSNITDILEKILEKNPKAADSDYVQSLLNGDSSKNIDTMRDMVQLKVYLEMFESAEFIIYLLMYYETFGKSFLENLISISNIHTLNFLYTSFSKILEL